MREIRWRLGVDPDITEDPRHRSITPRIALSHQAGFRNWRGNRTLEFIFDPGSRHEYSGEGFEYLRRALESKTDSTMAELMHRHVLEPTGMTSTSFGWDEAMRARMTRRFDETGELVDQGDDKRSANAAANTFTTIDDYARFAAWVANGAGLPKALFEAMSSPQALHENPAEEFGLGWKLAHVDGHAVLLHDGREAGIRTQVVALPESRDALVVLTNSSNGELFVRPIIQTALPQGAALVADLDRLVWQYLHRMPNEQIAPLSAGITRSPTFTSTLLHAANTMLIQTSPLSAREKRSASAAVDDFVFSLFSGELSADAASAVVAQLISSEGEQSAFRTQFDTDQARDWLAALRSASAKAD